MLTTGGSRFVAQALAALAPHDGYGLNPLFFPDEAKIEVWGSELTHVCAWMDFHITSVKTGKLAARARQRGVFVDAETNRPYRINAEDREAFGQVLMPEQA